MKMIKDMRERINGKWPAQIKATSEKALATFEAFSTKRSLLNKQSADYTIKVRELVLTDFGRDLRKLDEALGAHRTKIAGDREALHKKAFGDAGPLASEIRAFLRTSPDADRAKLLLGPNASKEAIAATLSGPLFLSGVSPKFAETVRKDFLEREFADDLAAIAEADAALEHATACAGLVQTEMATESKFAKPEAFGAWVETIVRPEPPLSDADEMKRLEAIEKRLMELSHA